MGMFNSIVCDYALPDLPAFVKPGHKFQTKDIHPLMLDTYTIDASGRISLDDFTGDFEFYTYDDNARERLAYAARFVAGQLVRIARTP